MTHPVVDPDAVVSAAWPLHGPYGDEHTTTTTTRAVAALVRYLNYATRAAAGLSDPAAVHDLLGALSAATAGLPQRLRQTGQRLTDLSDDPHACTDILGQALSAPQAARIIVEDLAAAAQRIDSAAQRLGAAHTLAGRLYLTASGGAS